MKELKHLSAKSINIKNIARPLQNQEQTLPLDENFPNVCLRSKSDAAHYSLFIQNKQIPFDKAADAEVKKVLHGTFKGCYVAIEKGGISRQQTRVFLLHPEGFVQLVECKQLLDIVEIDAFLTKDYLARITAEHLNTFDLGKSNQSYKFFLEKLPTFLLADKKHNFENSVLKHFFAKDINLIPNENNRFVRTELCKSEAYKSFLDFSKKIREEQNEIQK